MIAVLALLSLGIYQLWRNDMLPAGQAATDWYEVARDSKELVRLPEDDAPHDQYYMEWWYYNGHLAGVNNRRYSFHYVIFVINSLSTFTVAHVSFVDQATGQHYTAQRRTAGRPATHQPGQFDFQMGNWHMAGNNGRDILRLDAQDFAFNLKLENMNPPVLQGGTGLLDFRHGGSSYYYSRPRMRVVGTAGVRGEMQEVTGLAWFDHQWGDFRPAVLSWNWFALQLDNGADIMLFEFFDREGNPDLHSGTYALNGKTTVLTENDFETQATGQWKSEKTGVTYPMGWKVALPAQGVDLVLTPVIKNSEFDGRQTSYLVYWEGAVTITGSHKGQGFVELSGYMKESKTPPKAP